MDFFFTFTSMALKQAFSTTDGITDLLYVATHLDIGDDRVPDGFPFTYSVDQPIEVFSPAVVFGPESDYEFKNFFSLYDQDTETWKDGDTGAVAAEIKAAVLLQQTDFNLYLTQLEEWTVGYEAQKFVEYKKYVAQKLIDICAP